MKHKKLIFGLGIVLVGVVTFTLAALIPIGTLIPHKRISIILPFAPDVDRITGLIPMGETIFHPNAPGGHPGIDFGGQESFSLIPSKFFLPYNYKNQRQRFPIRRRYADATKRLRLSHEAQNDSRSKQE